MSSSNCFEIILTVNGAVGYERQLDELALPYQESVPRVIEYKDDLVLSITRPEQRPALRVCLGTDPIAELAAGETALETPEEEWFYNEVGESEIVLQEEAEEESGTYATIFRMPVLIKAHPVTQAHFEIMIADVASVHSGLAQDVVSRGVFRCNLGERGASQISPETIIRQLSRVHQRLKQALGKIARHPARSIRVFEQTAYYRPGDRFTTGGLYGLIQRPDTVCDDSGRIRSLGRGRVQRPALTSDLPEHRHLAKRLRELARICNGVAGQCRRSAALISTEEEVWGRPREGGRSVFEERDLPRVQRLEALHQQARSLQHGFLELVRRNAFLANAGEPRSRFGPTPIFMQRSAYREAYRILHDVKQLFGILVDGESVAIRYRSLSQLYEYWCYINVVSFFRERLGAPAGEQTFSLIDSVYRPEFESGQCFSFKHGLSTINISYEPSICPVREAENRGDRYGATLTPYALRPDILIEIVNPGNQTVGVVLDAKSTNHFNNRYFREISDYARQIFDLRDGTQPIRQVCLLHRDTDRRYRSNIPGAVRTVVDPFEIHEIGAIACVPERIGVVPQSLATVLEQVLRNFVKPGNGTGPGTAHRAAPEARVPEPV